MISGIAVFFALFLIAALPASLSAQQNIDAADDTARTIRTITREEIEKFNAPDLGTLLQEILHIGLTMYGPYGSAADVNMRGFNSGGIAFLVNGMPANSSITGGFDYFPINVDSIDRIEVASGGAGGRHQANGAPGGTINIITVKQEKRGFRGGGSIRNLSALPGNYHEDGDRDPRWEDLADTQRVSLTGGLGTEALSLSGTIFGGRAGNHFLYSGVDPSGTRRNEGSEVWDVGGTASLSLLFPNLVQLSLYADIYYGNKNPRNPPALDMSKDAASFSSRQTIKIDIPGFGRKDISSELILNNSQQTFSYLLDGEELFHNEYVIALADRMAWYVLPRLTLRAQADYRYISLESINLSSGFRHDIGIFFAAEYAPVEDLLITPSIKGTSIITAAGFFPAPIPKLSLVWHAADALYIKNNYFRNYTFPNMLDFYLDSPAASGNSSLRPEDGWGGDIGAEYRFGNLAILEGAFFGQWTDGMILWSGDSGTRRPRNSGDAASFGMDAETRFAIPTAPGPFTRVDLSLSYRLLLSYFLGNGYTFDSDKRLPLMPVHIFGFTVDVPWKTGSFLVSGHFEGDRYTAEENTIRLAPFFLLTLSASQRINEHFTAFMTLRNVFNMPNETFQNVPMPGLTITLGLKINFEEHY
jgi:vitamin B12 transporter